MLPLSSNNKNNRPNNNTNCLFGYVVLFLFSLGFLFVLCGVY